MKNYTKPMVNVVSLKSSEDIAKTTFKQIRGNYMNSMLNADAIKKYALSQYVVTNSTSKEVTDA